MSHSSKRSLIRAAAALLAASTILAGAPATAQNAAASPAAATPAPATAHFGTWGIDLSTRDLSVKPGDDFQRYASGKWMDTHDIPADQTQNGVGYEAYLRNQGR